MLPLHPALQTPSFAVLACCLLFALASGPTAAQTGHAPARFEATTTNMTPSDLALEIHVLEWSDQMARNDVLAALASESDVRSQLSELPTHGYIWIEGSSVGHAIKYAHRATSGDGGERITLVTDRPLGLHSFEPWQIGGRPVSEETQYAAIELDLSDGTGLILPAADVVLDDDNDVIMLQRDDGVEPVLGAVGVAPESY